MKKITKTAGILIFRNNQVLLVKHTKKANHKTGVYGIPAGRLESGENEIQAAIRETYDETCLKIDKKNLLPLPTIYSAKIKRKNEPARMFSLQVFLCTKYEGRICKTEENIPEWVNISKLDSYNLLPNMKVLIMEGLSILKYESKKI